MPYSWLKAKVMFVFKEGDRNCCKTYKDTSLYSTSYKIYAEILNKRLMSISDILP